MARVFDNVGQSTATTGTGTVTLGAVITDAANGDYQTFQAAGAVAGDVVNVRITNGNTWENSTGTLGGTGPGFTLTRTLVASSTGSLLNLSGTSKVYCVPLVAVPNIGLDPLMQQYTYGGL